MVSGLFFKSSQIAKTNLLHVHLKSNDSHWTKVCPNRKGGIGHHMGMWQICWFFMGLEFYIQTDHKPLVPLFSTKQLDKLSLRVQRFRMRPMRYQFTISHVSGKYLTTADTLSRAPSSESNEGDRELQNETEAYVSMVFQAIPTTERRLEEIRKHQEEDDVLRLVTSYCRSGWPEHGAVPGVVKPYYPVSSKLSIEKGVLMQGLRVVIPAALCVQILDKIHEGHQGISKCRDRAQQSIWWPGIVTADWCNDQKLPRVLQESTSTSRTVATISLATATMAEGWDWHIRMEQVKLAISWLSIIIQDG